MFLEGRESVLERNNDALHDPYHGAQPHGHQQHEDHDGPEGKSRKQRNDVSKGHNGHTWTLHNLWVKGGMVRVLRSLCGVLTPSAPPALGNYL